jgi:hypothetical protein
MIGNPSNARDDNREKLQPNYINDSMNYESMRCLRVLFGSMVIEYANSETRNKEALSETLMWIFSSVSTRQNRSKTSHPKRDSDFAATTVRQGDGLIDRSSPRSQRYFSLIFSGRSLRQ